MAQDRSPPPLNRPVSSPPSASLTSAKSRRVSRSGEQLQHARMQAPSLLHKARVWCESPLRQDASTETHLLLTSTVGYLFPSLIAAMALCCLAVRFNRLYTSCIVGGVSPYFGRRASANYHFPPSLVKPRTTTTSLYKGNEHQEQEVKPANVDLYLWFGVAD